MNDNSRATVTTTVGYMCIALTGWMISMSNAAWFSDVYQHGMALMHTLAIVLAVIGILTYLGNRGLDAIVFFGVAGLLWADYLAAGMNSGAMEPHSYTGWYAFVWAVFFCYVWLGSFKSGMLRMLFLLGLWLTLLALAIGEWGSLNALVLVGGYLGLITSVLAALTSAQAAIGCGATGGEAAKA